MDKSYIKYNTSFKVLFISVITIAIFFATLALVNKAEAKPTELECLTEAVYFEARGESFVGQKLEQIGYHRFHHTPVKGPFIQTQKL